MNPLFLVALLAVGATANGYGREPKIEVRVQEPLYRSYSPEPQKQIVVPPPPQRLESSYNAPAPQRIESNYEAPPPQRVESSYNAPVPQRIESNYEAPPPQRIESRYNAPAPQRVEISYEAPTPQRVVESSYSAPQRVVESSYSAPERVIESSYNAPQRVVASSYNAPQRVVESSYSAPQRIESSYNAPQRLESSYNAPTRQQIPILRFNQEIRGSDSDSVEFETGNGIRSTFNTRVVHGRPSSYMDENGRMVQTDSSLEQSGHSYHQAPNGEHIALTWSANSEGFRAVGDHLPKPVEMPAEHAEAHREALARANSYSSQSYSAPQQQIKSGY